ncbi:MAG: hypothetical protein WCF68_14990 [Terriglobales bacterium]
MKRTKSRLHLLLGIASLAIAAFFFREVAHGGKGLLQQTWAMMHPARSAKPGSAGDDSDDNTKVYGVLGEHGEADDGDDGDSGSSSGLPPPVDRIAPFTAADAGTPNHFLHKRLSVKTYQFFEFVVPAHAIRPELQGTFQSVATRQNPSGGPAVEVLLLDREEFSRFVNHKSVSAMLSSNSSRGGEIYWKLSAPVNKPRKYYLVFWNPAEGQGPRIVDADFSVIFE